jgi:hypothetical protein
MVSAFALNAIYLAAGIGLFLLILRQARIDGQLMQLGE